jgi:hypothetical protein
MRDGRVVVYLYVLLIIAMVCYAVNQYLDAADDAQDTIKLQHEAILLLNKENSELRSFINIYIFEENRELDRADEPIHNRLI